MPTTISQGFSKDQLRRRYNQVAPSFKYEEWVLDHLLGLKRLRRELFGGASGRVLDLAAGTGGNLRYLHAECEVTAVDLSPGMLDVARARAEKLGRAVTTRVMDAEALDYPDATFDTVISSLATCTFADPVAALREMARVCVPRGRILLLEHGRSSWKLLGRYQDRTAHQHYAQLGCRWNQEPLELVEEAGLTVTRARRHLGGVVHTIEACP
jgi:ubiquinone/menaquinone biosynthesis C-methylase UbiE